MKKQFNFTTLFIIVLDIFAAALAGAAAFFLRFEFSLDQIPAYYLNNWLRFLPVEVLVIVALFFFTRMYRFMWRFVSLRDVVNMGLSSIGAYVIITLLRAILHVDIPRSIMGLEPFIGTILFIFIRCCPRIVDTIQESLNKNKNIVGGERVMIIGAGDAGRMLAREILGNRETDARVICAIDDNPAKWGKFLEGIPIVGGRDTILYTVRKEQITEIIFAIPTAAQADRRELFRICGETGCKVKTLPSIQQMVDREFKIGDVKDVQVEDLLGREPVKLNLEGLNAFLGGKTVLVTGGGGSIGSELCRQVMRYNPERLVILDIYENNAYDLQQELFRRYGRGIRVNVEIASVRERERMRELFTRYRPDVVFHAAAHKHVPLMEDCPAEAVKNNIFGTLNVLSAAEEAGTGKFVFISTDKAVNPTNVMGATKRFCEMLLQSRPAHAKTECCAVRFGNVLGSNGSVIPLFKKQIEEGGPVTVTDKRIIRYFMTIPEAAQLVLEAGSIAHRNQIFVLDMGEPVKIISLAEDLIRLSGLEPYKDIEIEEIGLRPGEKLYEELLMASETLLETDNNKIFVEQQHDLDPVVIEESLERLRTAVTIGLPDEDIVTLLKFIVPTYHAPGEPGASGTAAQ